MRRRPEWTRGSKWLIVALALCACSKSEPPIQADKPAVDAPAPTSKPEPAPTTSATARVAPAPLPPPRISEAQITLHLFDGDPTAHAFERDRRSIFVVGGKMVVVPTFATLVDGKLAPPIAGFEFQDFPGEDNHGETVGSNWIFAKRVMGRYPDELWVASEGSYGIIAPRSDYTAERTYVHQRQYGSWGRVKDNPIAAAPWSKGRTLAYLDTDEFKLARPLKGKLGELPKQQPGQKRDVRVRGMALSALTTGEVLLLGIDRDAQDQLTIERWDSDTGDGQALAHSRLVPLPAPPGKAISYWLTANRDVAFAAADYGGTTFLAEIRGDAVNVLSIPVKAIADVQVAADGTLFVYGDETIYRYDGRKEGVDQFTRAVVSPSIQVESPMGFFAESKESVYLAVETRNKHASLILSSVGRPPPSASAAPEASAAPVGATTAVSGDELLASFPAASAACEAPFVVLFAVSAGTPRGFKFPQTQRIVKDFAGREKLRVVDFDHRGARFVGVVAPDVKTAEAFALHWNARDEKSKSRPACFTPPDGARKLEID